MRVLGSWSANAQGYSAKCCPGGSGLCLLPAHPRLLGSRDVTPRPPQSAQQLLSAP